MLAAAQMLGSVSASIFSSSANVSKCLCVLYASAYAAQLGKQSFKLAQFICRWLQLTLGYVGPKGCHLSLCAQAPLEVRCRALKGLTPSLAPLFQTADLRSSAMHGAARFSHSADQASIS